MRRSPALGPYEHERDTIEPLIDAIRQLLILRGIDGDVRQKVNARGERVIGIILENEPRLYGE